MSTTTATEIKTCTAEIDAYDDGDATRCVLPESHGGEHFCAVYDFETRESYVIEWMTRS